MARWGSNQSAIRTRGCPGGLDHLIVLRAGYTFFDEPFIVTAPLAVLVVV